MTSGGMLIAKISGEERILCRYSNSYARKLGLFCKLANKLKEGKELTEEDFADEASQAYCPKCGLMYPDSNRKICPKCLDKRSIFLRVLSFVPRYKVQIAAILVLMFLSSALSLINPYIGGNVFFDKILNPEGEYHGRILEFVLIAVGVQLIHIVLSIIYSRINAGMTAQVIYDLKTDVFSAMQKLSLSFFSNKQTGTLMTRVNNDATHLQYFFHDGLPFFIVNLVTLIGITVVMMLINWKLALLVLVPVPVIIYVVKTIYPMLWTLLSKRYRSSSTMNALINDTLTGMRVVKAFGKEQSEVRRFENANDNVYSVNVDLGKMNSTAFPFLHYIMGIGGLIVWGVGGWQVVNGTMTFGTLVTFTGYLAQIYGPLTFMTNIVDWWSNCMNSAHRIFEVIDAVPEVSESPNPVRIPDMKGRVTFRDVTFSYEPNKPVLRDINIDVKAGEMIGIVGRSGAGKSTIANLISRLYDVEEGEILIDGINIKNIALRDLHSQIGMVLQETFLFTGTIAENIAYAKPDADMEEIINAAKIANAHDFIMKLPDGYDTIIGRRGYNMSGGERQRVSIARAVLLNPKILILDEATASVDTETEGLIQEALERLIKGRTTFSIAHRLSTLRNADRLMVLESGKVVELGTHDEVVRLKGTYFNLLMKQKEALRMKGVGE